MFVKHAWKTYLWKLKNVKLDLPKIEKCVLHCLQLMTGSEYYNYIYGMNLLGKSGKQIKALLCSLSFGFCQSDPSEVILLLMFKIYGNWEQEPLKNLSWLHCFMYQKE